MDQWHGKMWEGIGEPEDFIPIPYKQADFSFTFSFTEAALDAADREMLRAWQEEVGKRLLDHISDQMARTCLSGHVHHTVSGRLFCDAMGGD